MFNIPDKKSLFSKVALILFTAGLLELMLFITWENTVATLRGDIGVMNIVGSERMRLLKITLLTEHYAEGVEQDVSVRPRTETSRAKVLLDNEINVFEDILIGLRDGNPRYNLKKQNSPVIIARLNRNIDKWNKTVKPMLQTVSARGRTETSKGLKDYNQEIFTYLDDINGLVVLFETHSEEKINRLLASQVSFLFLSGLTALGSLIGVYTVIIKPIKKLNRAVTAMASGDLSQIVPVLSKDEIGELSASFNLMSYHIKSRTDSLMEREKRLRTMLEMQQRYEELLNNLNVAVCGHMADGRFVEVNPAAVAMFEAGSKEELAKYNVADFYKDKNRLKEVTDKLLKYSSVKNEELEVLTTKGRAFWCSLSAVAKKDTGGNVYINCIVEDINEKRILEEQLRQSQKMEAVGQLAGGIAHDFNNILTAIIGYGNLLIRKKQGDGLVEEYAGEIISSANRAAVLTRDLLTFSRKHTINPQPADLNELIKMVEKILARTIGEHIELKVILADRNLIVKMDMAQIEQVLLNLATNARDAMPEGGKLTINISHVKLDNKFIDTHNYGIQGQYALITFADTGAGIDKNIQSRIFEPFFTTKEVGKGTGLGLSMVYGIIKQHNGYINVYSEPGHGAVFKIYLPLLEDVALGEKRELPGIAAPKGNMETILVAEDDPDTRRAIKAVLEEYNYRVVEAVDGIDAISKFTEKNGEIKLLILDTIMPKAGGKQAYEGIKNIDPDIKVIFISGYTADMIKTKDLLETGFYFLAKPIAPDKLLAKIREVIK